MTNEDRRRLVTTLTAVHAYYGKDMSDVAVRFWIEDLDGYSMDDIERAFVRHRRDPVRGRFMPMTADILAQLSGDAEESALVAWGNVLEAARLGGRRFDGATQQAIDAMGGMGRIRMASPSENGFLQREFCAAFKAYRARGDREALTDGSVRKLLEDVAKGTQ